MVWCECVPERLLSVVQVHVPLQVVFESKAQAAGVAGEGLLFGVDQSVLQQPHLALEALVALAAFERPLLRMRPLVDPQVAGGGKRLVAHLAGVGPSPRVDGLVLPEALLPVEALPADVAHEGLDFGVRHLVVPERCGGGEGAVAHQALQGRLLQAVDGLVDLQLAQHPELPVALVAAQQLVGVALPCLLQLVALLVLLEGLRLVEAFLAGAAGEGLLVTGHVLHQLVLLMVTFVTELTEEPLLFVQLPPPHLLLLLLLLLAQSCRRTEARQNHKNIETFCTRRSPK